MDEYLKLMNVGKKYPDFVLDNISLALPKGYIMGLVGPNGSGKTTTIQLVLNMLNRKSGKIFVFGKDNIEFEETIKQELGTVFDSSFYVEGWTVKDVEKANAIFYHEWDHRTFGEMLKRFGLTPDKKVGKLSRGMQMKLMLACAFSHKAKLLLLDEPTSGLDPVIRSEFLEILQEYIADGERSVLFSTHITTDLERVADFITVLNQGEMVYSGSVDNLLESYRIVKGDPRNLTSEIEGSIRGLRKTDIGFEGLIERRLADGIGIGNFLVEPSTIDDVVVFTSRGN